MNQRFRSGFSLVEVTIALGIAAFCLVTLLGLVPIGLNTNRNSVQQTAAASIAGSVVTDIRNQLSIAASSPTAPTVNKTPRYGFDLTTAGRGPHTVYVADDGSATTLDAQPAAGSTYRVTVGFLSPAGRQPREATPVRIVVSWPARRGESTTDWPLLSHASGSFETTLPLDMAR